MDASKSAADVWRAVSESADIAAKAIALLPPQKGAREGGGGGDAQLHPASGTGDGFALKTLFVCAAVCVFLGDNPTSKSHSRRPIGSSRPPIREIRALARPRVAVSDGKNPACLRLEAPRGGGQHELEVDAGQLSSSAVVIRCIKLGLQQRNRHEEPTLFTQRVRHEVH